MKKITFILLLFFLTFLAYGQNEVIDFNPFSEEELAIIMQDSTKIKEVDKFQPSGILGVKYSYQINGVSSTPEMDQRTWNSYKNIGLVYTYYNDLWNMMSNFGTRISLKYCEEGFDCDFLENERFQVVELDLESQFHFDFSRFRLFLNIGPYAGYRLNSLKEDDTWDKYDNRFDYGLIGGAGFGLIFKPFELQIEAGYKYALSSYYHANKFSDEYWLSVTPRNIILSATLFIHLF